MKSAYYLIAAILLSCTMKAQAKTEFFYKCLDKAGIVSYQDYDQDEQECSMVKLEVPGENWSFLFKTDVEEAWIHDNVIEQPNKRGLWILINRVKPESLGKGKKAFSTNSFIEIECSSMKFHTMQIMSYSKPNAQGELVHNWTGDDVMQIPPDSPLSELAELLCNPPKDSRG